MTPIPAHPGGVRPASTRRRCAAAFGVLAMATVACAGGARDADQVDTGADGERAGELVVFATASLTEAFTAIGDAFMQANPGATVVFNFAASSELAAQVAAGALADVVATADAVNMRAVTDAVVESGSTPPLPTAFATNSMQIVVGRGNPNGVTGLADLAAADLLVVRCADQVPCGRYAVAVLENAGVTLTPVSLERNVKGVLSKVALGEADAGIVYRSDVIAAGDDVTGIDIPAGVNVVAEYPIVALTEGRAAAFVDFVLGPIGRAVLAKYGFGVP